MTFLLLAFYEDGLTEVISQVCRPAQQYRITVSVRLTFKVLWRYCLMPVQPLGRCQLCKFTPKQIAQLAPHVAHGLTREIMGNSTIRLRDEDQIQLGIAPFTEAKKRNHPVVGRREVSPNVDQATLARSDLLL